MKYPEAVFFDRDGTLIVDIPYLHDQNRLRLEKSVGHTLSRLGKLNIPIIVITNQSGIGRYYFSWKTVHQIHQELQKKLKTFNIKILDFFICPHHPESAVGLYKKSCLSRKPHSGLIQKACKRYSLNPKNCFMVGDRLSDVIAGQELGCKSFLVNTGLAVHIKDNEIPKNCIKLSQMSDLLNYL